MKIAFFPLRVSKFICSLHRLQSKCLQRSADMFFHLPFHSLLFLIDLVALPILLTSSFSRASRALLLLVVFSSCLSSFLLEVYTRHFFPLQSLLSSAFSKSHSGKAHSSYSPHFPCYQLPICTNQRPQRTLYMRPDRMPHKGHLICSPCHYPCPNLREIFCVDNFYILRPIIFIHS